MGVVLAGGASRRLGRDKARLEAGAGTGISGTAGESLGVRAVRKLAAVCSEVVLADAGRSPVEGVRSVPDGPGRGPAAGLLGAAGLFPGRTLLVLACDLPLVPVPLLAEIAAADPCHADLSIPRRAAGLEPLCAAYGPRALAALARRVERGELALHPLAAEPGLAVRILEEAELARYGVPDAMLLNLNTAEDLERWRRIEEGG